MDDQLKIPAEKIDDEFNLVNLLEGPSVIPMRDLIGADDSVVSNWKIITVKLRTEELETRHMFGWNDNLRTYVISSKILEDQEAYIRTKSRKYFKHGEPATTLYSREINYLYSFLRAWGFKEDEIHEVIERHK